MHDLNLPYYYVYAVCTINMHILMYIVWIYLVCREVEDVYTLLYMPSSWLVCVEM